MCETYEEIKPKRFKCYSVFPLKISIFFVGDFVFEEVSMSYTTTSVKTMIEFENISGRR